MPFDHLPSTVKDTIEVTGNPAFRKELSDTTQKVISLRFSPYAIAGVWGQPPPSQLPSAGRQPANGEASGLPEAMLAFTKYPTREAPERTAVFTRFSEQFFGNGIIYCAEDFKKVK